MMLYDVVLLIGLIAALGILVIEYGFLAAARKRAGVSGKTSAFAILTILFMATAVVAGSAVTSYVADDNASTGLQTVAQNVRNSNEEVSQIQGNLQDLKQTVSSMGRDVDPDLNQRLMNQISMLERQLNDVLKDNKDLEDDLKDLEDELDDVYALLPGGHY